MIATASQLGDARTRAKNRMRAAARSTSTARSAPAKSARSSASTMSCEPSPAKKAAAFVRDHPTATVAALVALSAVVGPVRLVRLGMATVKTVSMATGVAKFVKTLPEATKGFR